MYFETLGLFRLKNTTLRVEGTFALHFLILHLQKGVPFLTFHLKELEGRREEGYICEESGTGKFNNTVFKAKY